MRRRGILHGCESKKGSGDELHDEIVCQVLYTGSKPGFREIE